jgi:hypothetical protein
VIPATDLQRHLKTQKSPLVQSCADADLAAIPNADRLCHFLIDLTDGSRPADDITVDSEYLPALLSDWPSLTEVTDSDDDSEATSLQFLYIPDDQRAKLRPTSEAPIARHESATASSASRTGSAFETDPHPSMAGTHSRRTVSRSSGRQREAVKRTRMRKVARMPSLERAASALFSTAMFRPVLRGEDASRAEELIRTVRDGTGMPQAAANAAVVHTAYDVMTTNYRAEYVYRNLITTRVFVGRHRASRATAFLNEVRVGASVADCVLINGRMTVYEIKTELDRQDRLQSQLDSYYGAFPLVNVVVHEAHVDRYLDMLGNTETGILSVGSRWRLSTVRPARDRTTQFDHRVLFNLLRAREVEQALRAWYGDVTAVPNGIRYSEHFALAQAIPPIRFHDLVHDQLRARGYRGSRASISMPELAPLRALLVQLQPSEDQHHRLLEWLERSA